MTKFTQEQIEHLGKRIEFLDAEDTEKGFSVRGNVEGSVRGNVEGDVGKKEAATNRLRRKLEILKLDAAKSRGQLFHDLQECLALMDIIEKER